MRSREEPFFAHDQNYVSTDIYDRYGNEWDEKWEGVLQNLKHGHPTSSFDGNFDFEIGRKDFLRKLGYLISKPVVPGAEADYLITQSMAEYLAFVHEQRVDGVIFRSAQYEGGRAIALFPRPNFEGGPDAKPFPLKFVAGSLEFVKISGMKYTSYPVQLHTRGSGEVLGDFPLVEVSEDELDTEGIADA